MRLIEALIAKIKGIDRSNKCDGGVYCIAYRFKGETITRRTTGGLHRTSADDLVSLLMSRAISTEYWVEQVDSDILSGAK